MNEKLLNMLEGKTEFYPYILEERFSRVFNKIVELCGTKLFDAYLLDLLVDNQGGTRQGFPPDAASEILRLSNFRSTLRSENSKISVWDSIQDLKRVQIERLGFDVSPSSFLRSIDQGNKEAVRIFLSCGVDLEVKDERDWTPLMFSVSNRNEEFALLFIQCGARVIARDKNGFTPLHWAALNGMTKVVEALLSKNADINLKSKFGWTSLMQSCIHGHTHIANALIFAGAEVDARNSDGSAALHIAAGKGYIEIVQLLLSSGADRGISNQDGNSPLALASRAGHHSIVDLLSEGGASDTKEVSSWMMKILKGHKN